ncbi:MAG: hypothetical protein NDJ72_10105 [Elusimicrobia bacterium]|nr:hypothetical protein [Elusimicrobiota bacterium]
MVGSRAALDPAAVSAAARGLEFTVRPSGIRRLVRDGGRRALIELVRVEGQEEFYARLESALGRPGAVPRMPAHVTLFTEPGGRGIALYSAAQLESLSRPADPALAPGPWRLDEGGAILGA